MFRQAVVVLVVCCCTAARAADRISYLDNGSIRLGVNLDLGGSITYLSKSGEDHSVVNNFDWGRQIQMSHYSGPAPFLVPGKEPKPEWKNLGWNPIQSGDCFGNRSRVIYFRNDGKSIDVKCVPMQWPLNNVPGECTFECWITLQNNTAAVRCQLVNDRSDPAQYPARSQELPAIYTIAPLYRLMSYTGDQPFTSAAWSRLERTEDEKLKNPGFPWTGARNATECWTALVDDHNQGLGIWHPHLYHIIGGFVGKSAVGGPRDSATGYIAPLRQEILDHNITYDYRYVLIVGSLEDIRQYVYDHAPRPAPLVYRFEHDRQHWYFHDAHDTGWPIRGELDITADAPFAQLIGPDDFWFAKDGSKLQIEAAFTGHQSNARIYWKRHDDDRFTLEKSQSFPVQSDGTFHRYEIALNRSPQYKQAITALRLDFATGLQDRLQVRSIAITAK